MRHCSRCDRTKPLSEFSIKKDGKPHAWCKTCAAEHARTWYRENQQRARAARQDWYENNRERANARMREYKRERPRQYKAYRLKEFGLTLEDFDRMLDEQGGVCAICRRPPTGQGRNAQTLHVDHCHKTNKVRGLLCGACNTALGLLQEDPTVIRRLLRYTKDRC